MFTTLCLDSKLWKMIISLLYISISSLHLVLGSEIYSLIDIKFESSQILNIMPKRGEVQCILGCKHYKGCVTSSFNKISKDDRTGNCTYYATQRSDSRSNTLQSAAHVMVLDEGYYDTNTPYDTTHLFSNRICYRTVMLGIGTQALKLGVYRRWHLFEGCLYLCLDNTLIYISIHISNNHHFLLRK